MISKQIILVPKNSYYGRGRQRVVTSTFKLNGYNAHFAIKDTTKEKLGFFRGIGHNAELFAFVYTLKLNKDIIGNSDSEQFAKYRQGLDDATKQDTLLTYQTKQKQSPEVPELPTELINPWPDLENKIMGKD